MVESRKYKINICMIDSIKGFFEARAEIQKYFHWFTGSNENFKICFQD